MNQEGIGNKYHLAYGTPSSSVSGCDVQRKPCFTLYVRILVREHNRTSLFGHPPVGMSPHYVLDSEEEHCVCNEYLFVNSKERIHNGARNAVCSMYTIWIIEQLVPIPHSFCTLDIRKWDPNQSYLYSRKAKSVRIESFQSLQQYRKRREASVCSPWMSLEYKRAVQSERNDPGVFAQLLS